MAEPPVPGGRHILYPVSLDVSGRRCLVVGGGSIAARKARSLLQCGAQVTVIASAVSEEMRALSPLAIEQRAYRRGDTAGFQLVLTATGLAEVDGMVHADAEAANIWVNSADDVDHCTFTLPSVHRDGSVTVAVSTDGASPALASWLRGEVAPLLEGTGELAQLLASARTRVKASGRSTEDVDWRGLLDGVVPGLVREGRLSEAAALIDRAAGLSG
jgi:siroheme synthase-like protein